ncbi:MAG: diguanylate cyclase [Methyloprofundus sp.]|nr:MAG: diguanylate cyclase [Methyloprofundus sp.]
MQWLNRYSLSTKALLTGIMVGFLLWLSMDFLQKQQLDKLFNDELLTQLEYDSQSAQSHFYKAIEEHAKIVTLFAKQKSIVDFILANKPNSLPQSTPPQWVPEMITWRGLILPSAFILYDKNHQPIDQYNIYADETLPAMFTQDASDWLNASVKSPMLSQVDGNPALIVSAAIFYQQQVIGFITIFVRIDDHFMYSELAQDLSPGAIAVLFAKDTDTLSVLTSSDLVRAPKGALATNLQQSYLFGGKGLFDQGDWSLQAKLFILLPQGTKDHLAISVRHLERQQRFIAAIIFVAVFTLLMVLLSRRIQHISNSISRFAKNELDITLSQDLNVDAVANLQECFDKLSIEITESHYKLLLQHEMERKVDQLQILESVTDSLRVGVLERDAENWAILNSPMHQFVNDIGDISPFIVENSQQSLVDKSGERRIFTISHMETDTRSLILVNEVTELAIKTEELTKMALYDALTGLPNRVLFHDRLNQLIDCSKRNKETFSVLLIDLDHFKEVNDTLGHSTGDQLLFEVAYRFSQYIRSTDTFARIGGDEFAIILPHADAKTAELVAHKLVDAQQQPYQILTHAINVGASIGIVTYPDNGRVADLIMSRADMAMYHAKRNHFGFFFYQSEIDSSDQERLRLVADLRVAIQRKAISVYYQPQLHLESKTISGWEALARWYHTEHGWISPEVFIPIAEENGLINAISSIVLQQAILDCSQWQSAGQSGGVSINLSTRDLIDSQLTQKVALILAENQLGAEQVTLEVTESTLMQDPVKAKHELELLDKLGVSLSVDDFGTGYSSLAYLKHLPVDEVKIDQVFVKNIIADPSDAAIVRAVLGLAQNLKLKVVAEGVESKDIYQQLEHFGCDFIQGYYLAKPMSFDQLINFNINHIDTGELTTKG